MPDHCVPIMPFLNERSACNNISQGDYLRGLTKGFGMQRVQISLAAWDNGVDFLGKVQAAKGLYSGPWKFKCDSSAKMESKTFCQGSNRIYFL